MLLSATATPEALHKCQKELSIKDPFLIKDDIDRPNIFLNACIKDVEDEVRKPIFNLIHAPSRTPMIGLSFSLGLALLRQGKKNKKKKNKGDQKKD